jgi:hypothetical protein
MIFGLLIVLCLVLLWASPPRGSLETNSIGSLRAYCSAQSMYKRNDWDADTELEYAYPFKKLDTCPSGAGMGIQLVDGAFLAACGPKGIPKHGYLFLEPKTMAGKPIDWTKDFALCGTPAEYGKSGYRTFIVKTDGVIWGKDLGKSQFVMDFPAAPACAGWEKAE